jgi:hypothetical protein
VTLGEDHWLTGFENMVPRRILAPRRDEVTGDRRKLPNKEFRDLCSLSNICSSRSGMGRHGVD